LSAFGKEGEPVNRNHWRLVLVWVLWAALGCGASSDVAVTGTVTLDGQPLTNALVTFYPEGKTPGLGGNGRTGADGKYTLTPNRKGQGLAPGEYRVVISRRLNPDGSVADPNVPPIESKARETLPPIYSQRESSKLKANVSKDQTVYDFPLESPSKKK
jgi:hypothetical protein